MLKKYLFPFALLAILLLFSFASKFSVNGLHITFKKKREDYVLTQQISPMASMPYIEAAEGMKFVILKMKFENRGSSECSFDAMSLYISDEKDALYPTYSMYSGGSNIKIRPGKSTTHSVIFQFPNESDPKHLYVEDKKFSVVFD